MLRSGTADVFGADSGLIAAISGGYPEGKIVPGAFNMVRIACALPKGHSAAAQNCLPRRNEPASCKKAINQAGLKMGIRVAGISDFCNWHKTTDIALQPNVRHDVRTLVDRWAAKHGLGRSEAIRALIEQGLKK